MKILKCMYNGTEQILPCTEDTMQWAKENAVSGEYTIVDDGQPEPESQPTQEERIAELETMMNALLGVSE